MLAGVIAPATVCKTEQEAHWSQCSPDSYSSWLCCSSVDFKKIFFLLYSHEISTYPSPKGLVELH